MRLISALIVLFGCAAPAVAQSVAQPVAQSSGQSSGQKSQSSSVAVDGVVELFTSQGCSACPAADTLLGKLAARPNILAMSFSVDYWDYLGWKDTLASHKFTKRQRAYAKARGDGQVYTPQIVVNGATHVVGSELPAIEKALGKTRQSGPAWIPINIRADQASLHIEAGDAAATASKSAVQSGPMPSATLWFVAMASKVDIAIQRGENAGKTLTYYNVVREFTPIGMWSGEPMSIRLDKQTISQSGADVFAVLLQQGHAGLIIGAALLPAK